MEQQPEYSDKKSKKLPVEDISSTGTLASDDTSSTVTRASDRISWMAAEASDNVDASDNVPWMAALASDNISSTVTRASDSISWMAAQASDNVDASDNVVADDSIPWMAAQESDHVFAHHSWMPPLYSSWMAERASNDVVVHDSWMPPFYSPWMAARASDNISPTVTLDKWFGGEASSFGWGRTRVSKMVLEWLDDPTVSTIGIYGIGGVGKTAVALHIEDQLRNRPNQSVSLVTVSQNLSIHKLQDDIASTLNIDLSDEDDEEKRAEKLSTALEEKNVVLILDGLPNPISLEDVGITSVGCKLIFTTRSFELCQMMNCHKVIRLERLSSEEGWELFKDNFGIIPLFSIHRIARSIVKECSGLPLAIVTMAANMKGVEDLGEWRSALNRIKKNRLMLDDDDVDSSTNEIYRVLQYCYDKLKDPIVQQCLLYCQSYPQEFKIDREMLIENLIDAGLVDGKNREAEFNNGNAILDKLENAFLLEGGTCKYGKRYVKMNNSVRAFLLSLSSSKLRPEFSKRIPEDDSQIDEHQLVVNPDAGEVVTVSADPDE